MVEDEDDARGRFSCARPAPCTEASNCLPVGASLALARGRTCTAASKQSQSQRTERRETICLKGALFDLLQLLIERLDERELSGLQGRHDLVQMRRRFGRRFGCCQGKGAVDQRRLARLAHEETYKTVSVRSEAPELRSAVVQRH